MCYGLATQKGRKSFHKLLLVSIRNYLKSDRQIDLNQILEQTIFNGIVFIAREVGIAVSIYSHVKQTLRGMSSFSWMLFVHLH